MMGEVAQRNRYFVRSSPEGVRVSPLFDYSEQAKEALEDVRGSYPDATLGRLPAKSKRPVYLTDTWVVSSFRVVTETERNGKVINEYPISGAYATRSQAEARLAELQVNDPKAWVRHESQHCLDVNEYRAAIAQLIYPE